MIFAPLVLLPLVAWANSPHLWVVYVFAYLWWVRGSVRWTRS